MESLIIEYLKKKKLVFNKVVYANEDIEESKSKKKDDIYKTLISKLNKVVK